MKLDKVLFLNENQVGDVLLSTALIKAFHDQYPASYTALYVSSDVAPLVTGLPFLNEVVVYDKGDPVWPVVRKIWRFDAALMLDFKYRSAVMPFLARIPIRAGVRHKRGLFMNCAVERDPQEVMHYEPWNFAKMIDKAAGLKIHLDEANAKPYIVEAPVTVQTTVDRIFQTLDAAKITVVIAPFTSCEGKNWPAERYAEFCRRFRTKYPVQFLITGVHREYHPECFSNASMLDLRDQTSLEEVSEIIRRADYFIGSCSAPLHMSAAWETPSVALYSSTSPLEWAPRQKTEIIQHLLPCSPCNVTGETCRCEELPFACASAITVDEVLAAMERLMHRYPVKR
jgi:ADP-heptose:LPS heptosyltransferase